MAAINGAAPHMENFEHHVAIEVSCFASLRVPVQLLTRQLELPSYLAD